MLPHVPEPVPFPPRVKVPTLVFVPFVKLAATPDEMERFAPMEVPDAIVFVPLPEKLALEYEVAFTV